MPTYDYVCLQCNNRFEQFQGINDTPLDICPECNGVVKRLITGGSGFIMKNGNVSSGNNMHKPSCGKDTTCCGSEYTCGKPEDCHS